MLPKMKILAGRAYMGWGLSSCVAQVPAQPM
jgi:hypothetical protein